MKVDPSVSITDCCNAEITAFNDTFGMRKNVHCWFHRRKTLDSKVKGLSKEEQTCVMKDVFCTTIESDERDFL